MRELLGEAAAAEWERREKLGEPYIPFATYDKTHDCFEWVEKDCIMVTVGDPGAILEQFVDPDTKKIIGFRINNFSRVASPAVIAAFLSTQPV